MYQNNQLTHKEFMVCLALGYVLGDIKVENSEGLGGEVKQAFDDVLGAYFIFDVDGGGTRFNELNLTVLPRLGRGVLWTNYADDTWRADPRTHHEALPVDRGVKYALNIWAHQHDLQTRRGQCAYSGRANVQGGEWADL